MGWEYDGELELDDIETSLRVSCHERSIICALDRLIAKALIVNKVLSQAARCYVTV